MIGILCHQLGIAHFAHIYFSNIDISLIITAIRLKHSIHIAETHFQRSVSIFLYRV